MTVTDSGSFKRKRGRPRQVDRTEEVIRAAATHFGSRGYLATTLEDIANDLEMTRPALYNYAKSKKDLLSQCYEWTSLGFIKRAKDIDTGTGRERLRAFFMVYAETVCDDETKCILFDERHHLNEAGLKASRARRRKINAMVDEILTLGREDGTLAAVNSKLAITALFGAFNMLPTLLTHKREDLAQVTSSLLDLLLEGLAA